MQRLPTRSEVNSAPIIYDANIDSDLPEFEEETEEEFNQRAEEEARRQRIGRPQIPRSAPLRSVAPVSPGELLYSQLEDAILNQDLATLRALLRRRLDALTLMGAFNYAVARNNLPAIKLLVQAGVYNMPNALSSALAIAILNRDIMDRMPIVKYLANLRNTDLNPALTTAASRDYLELVRYLISLGANDYQLALETAVEYGSTAVLTYLLRMFSRIYTPDDLRAAYAIAKNINDENATNILRQYLEKTQ